MNIKKILRESLVSICIISLFGVSYAALSSLTATSGETLTATKWNNLVEHAVPSGAVLSFNLSTCPTGWLEYTEAYGRVVRGLDKSGTNIDPDGLRALGNLQTDQLQGHFHNNTFSQLYVAAGGLSVARTNFSGASQVESERVSPTRTEYITDSVNGTPRVGNETRSKNVALLYCIKS